MGSQKNLASWFHRSISGTFKVSLQAFAVELSLCESCERLADTGRKNAFTLVANL